jgi:glucosyl-3-phosphoglycerate synthase
MSGYAVEIGLLWDIHERVGLAAMGQVDLGVRRHRNQPTAALGRMAYSITQAVLRREGLATAEGDSVVYERPVAHGGRVMMDRTPMRVDELPPMVSIGDGTAPG